MMRNISLVIVLFCILGIMSGCSTSGSLNVHKSVTDEPIQGETIDLKVVPANAAWNQVAFRLKGAVLTQLLGAGLFKKAGDENADYKITIKLTEVREVSGVSRVMLGIFAGSNQIAGNTTVVNLKTGQQVRLFSFRGESASHPFSGKSDMRDAVDKATEEIIMGLQ